MAHKSEPKRQNKKYIIARLGKYLLVHKWLLLLALVLTGTSNILALVGPRLSGYAIDSIELGKGKVNFERVFYYVGLMIVFYVISSILLYILSLVMINVSRKVVFKIREDVFDKLVELPVGFFDVNQTGDIISKISYDIDTINTSLSTDLIQICASVITVVGSFIMMLLISPVLVLVLVIMIPLSVFCTKYMTKRTRPLFRKRSKKLGELNGFVEEMLSGQKTIRAYNQEQAVLGKFDVKNEEAVNAYYNAEYYGSIVGPVINFINNLSLTFISVFGSILYLLQKSTLGNISAFVLYSRKFSGPINEMANIMSELQSAFAAAERVFKLMDELPETKDRQDAKELLNVYGDVELKAVKFGYTKDKIIIHNLDLKARKGSLIAIVGPTGAGKTTLINLLLRFYDVNNGTIYVDNNEIQDITRESLRKSYAMVLQDTWLFHGTIFDNIAYGKENATMDQVVQVAKAAKIHSYIKHLPDGYHTILSEDGANISKGQKQLLTIARAMLLESKMLILDEATSNVDTRTEVQIQEAMRSLMKDKTCFVIAHRLSTIRNADQILVVKEGNVVEQGTHTQLMKAQGVYHQLYYSQFD